MFNSTILALLTSLSICEAPGNCGVSERPLIKESSTSGIVENYSRQSCVVPNELETTFGASSHQFIFITRELVTNVVGEGDANLSGFKILNNEISCDVSNILDCGHITLHFFNDRTKIASRTLYFALDSNGNYYSSATSLDVCRRNAGQQLDYELIYDDSNSDSISNNYEDINPASVGVTGSVSGYLYWEDAAGNSHPLIGALVKATISGSWWNATCYTNQTGYYSIRYSNIWYVGSGKPSVHIFTEGANVKVHNGGTYSKSHEFNGSSGEWTYNYTFSPSQDDMGKAMMIFQGVKNYSDYACRMNGGNALTFCSVKYPCGNIEGCQYTNSDHTIMVGVDSASSQDYPEIFAAWDVLGHEYGHHVQNYYSLADNPGGDHHIGDLSAIDDQNKFYKYPLQEAKGRGLKLSFAEAWATYWSTIAQKSFSNDLKKIDTVGDTHYTATSFDYNLDEYSSRSCGDADEQPIQRILYKLYSPKIDDYDKFSLGESTMWNLILGNKPHTFSDFMKMMYENGYSKSDLALLLRQYNVVAGPIKIENNYYDRLPDFSWPTASGCDQLKYNQFDLYFLSSSGNIIKKIENINTSRDTCKYKIDASTWQAIYDAPGTTYKVYYVARQTDYFVSGNYYSETYTFMKPETFSSDKIQIKPSEWGFPARYFNSDEIISNTDNRYSNYHKNDLWITTDRLRCGYFGNDGITLFPRKEGCGNAYFQMDFNQPIYSFMFGIKMFSNNEMLDGEAVLKTKDYYGNWSTFLDLKKDISLTTNLVRNYYYFSDGIYGARFETNATAIGAEDRGRISLDDLVFGNQQNVSCNFEYITNYPKTAR